ncbi:hypothetical protein SKAU_G00009490 [Synaphobranchus kaupii]|uniref:Uncharacterized protein n=1 Tax=Synaphobranchus kaupii TaxID=118154 RepID=A0A9Q1JB22_SYNKA|nr:hypothetical protein SKAU_G00009490 [Synaphobranchus kaupii]
MCRLLCGRGRVGGLSCQLAPPASPSPLPETESSGRQARDSERARSASEERGRPFAERGREHNLSARRSEAPPARRCMKERI